VTGADLDTLLPLVGKAWIIGDGMSANALVRWVRQLGSTALPDAPAFVPGDFLVGGCDIGIGEDNLRAETATLRSLGVGALIARSFSQPFLNGAIERGLPALVIEEAAAIKAGDRLRIDIEEHRIANQSSGDRYIIRNLYDDGLDVLRAGGLAAYRLHLARNSGGTHQ